MIHERDFETSTTYPFYCMIFNLYRDAGVPICNRDSLRTPNTTVALGLIMDDANIEVSQRNPKVELQLLSENFADMVELARGAYPTTSQHTDATRTSQPLALVEQPIPLSLLHQLQHCSRYQWSRSNKA